MAISYDQESLILNLQFKEDNDFFKNTYYEIIKIFTNTLTMYSDLLVLSIIMSCCKKKVSKYFIDVYDTNFYKYNNVRLNILNFKIDFRDIEFPYIFDGMFTVTLASNDFLYSNDLNFTFIGGYNLYYILQKNEVKRVIVIFEYLNEINSIVITNKQCIKLIYPEPIVNSICFQKKEEKGIKKVIRGYIYIAQNDHISAIKIGRSINVEARIKQLSSPKTSLPGDYKLAYKKGFKYIKEVEKYIHEQFQRRGLRVANREFFKIDVEEAINFIKNIDEEEI